MNLRAPTLLADRTSPFGNDVLDRYQMVDLLAHRLGRAVGPATVAINGGWGAGKTAFHQMFAAHLRAHEQLSVILTATQHHIGPELAESLIADVSTQLEALPLAGPESSTTASGIADEACDDAQDGTDLDFAVSEGTFADLHRQLRTAVLDAGTPVFVLIDELDHCEPAAAVEMLSLIRSAFEVPGVIVVLAVNLDELEQRITHCFGACTDAAAMWRASIDIVLDLPPVSRDRLASLVERALAEDQITEEPTRPDAEMLAAALNHWNLSPRDIGQIAVRVSAVLDHAAPPSWFVESHLSRDVYARPLTAMAALQVADRTAFTKMFRRPNGAHAAAFSLLSSAVPVQASVELVATALAVALRDRDTGPEAFRLDCRVAGIVDDEQIDRLHEALEECRRSIGLDWQRLGKALDAFDLMV